MLLLNEGHIKNVVNMKEAIDVIDRALEIYDNNQYIQPKRSYSKVYDDNYYGVMSAFVEDHIGLKVVTAFPSNGKNNSKFPVTQGMIVLNDIHDGRFLSVMNATLLTAIKTGAVSGAAIRHLKSNAKSIGLAGTGLQGFYQLIAAVEAADIEMIYLYNRTPSKVEKFTNDLRAVFDDDINIVALDTVEEVVDSAEIIVTATTSSKPVLPNDVNYENKLVVAVGSFNEEMRELPENLFKSANEIYIDSLDGKKESGDVIDPIKHGWIESDAVIPISSIVTGRHKHHDSEAPIIFKNVSMALFDTMIAEYSYRKAVVLGEGTEFDL